MKTSSFRILATFDYNAPTGYSTVSRNLVENWKRTFGEDMHLDIVAVNYFGPDYSEGPNIKVVSAKMKDVGKDDFGRHVFIKSLMVIDYDLVFILGDLGTIVPMVPHLREAKREKAKANRKLFKSMIYFPVDFNLTPNLGVGLEFFDYLATFTEFGRRHAIAVNPAISKKIAVVPHGNNSKNFFRVPAQEASDFRRSYFGPNADKFIVGNVNRNQSRKDIPTTIFGFIEYWEEHNRNSMLYLHMHPCDPMGWDLRTVLYQTPLKEGVDYMFPSEEDYNKGADVSKLNLIYNSIDCFLSTATGGGWELTVTEAMSAGKPVIIPRHTSLEHLGGNNGERAYFLETLYPTVAIEDNVIRLQSDLYEICDTLALVKRHIDEKDDTLTKKLKAAEDFISGLKWSEIARTFSDVIKRLK